MIKGDADPSLGVGLELPKELALPDGELDTVGADPEASALGLPD